MSTPANTSNGHVPEVAARRGRGEAESAPEAERGPVEDLLDRAGEGAGELHGSDLADRVFGPGPATSEATLWSSPAPSDAAAHRARPRTTRRASNWLAFGETAARHLICVWPQVRRETAYWRARAKAIPARGLRETAEEAMGKRGNIEGAALFAVGAPKESRATTVRALVAYQAAYNYVDALGEAEECGGAANAEQLHQALLTALHAEAEEPDYYAEYEGDDDDGGYLTDLVGACRGALCDLPRWSMVEAHARDAAARIVDFQTLNRRESEGGHAALREWAKDVYGANEGDLAWWELAAGAGSSLGVHALIAGAANPFLDVYDAREIGRVYFPAGGGLHSMLDSLVDREEDEEAGFRSLLEYYSSGAQAALRLGGMAREGINATGKLSRTGAGQHRVILIAMGSYYLSASGCGTPEGRMVAGVLKGIFGKELDVAIGMFRAKRWLHNHLGSRFT